MNICFENIKIKIIKKCVTITNYIYNLYVNFTIFVFMNNDLNIEQTYENINSINSIENINLNSNKNFNNDIVIEIKDENMEEIDDNQIDTEVFLTIRKHLVENYE